MFNLQGIKIVQETDRELGHQQSFEAFHYGLCWSYWAIVIEIDHFTWLLMEFLEVDEDSRLEVVNGNSCMISEPVQRLHLGRLLS